MTPDGRFPAVDETLTMVPAPRSRIPGQRGARGADRAHQVELERRLPVGIGQLVEPADLRAADVVDETVDPAELGLRRTHDPLGLARAREVGDDVQVARSFPAPAGADDDGSLRLQLPCDREADPSGRAGDEAHLVAQAELHRVATLAA